MRPSRMAMLTAAALSLLAGSAVAQAVDPIPEGAGPYAGAGPRNFYDVGQRIDRLHQALASGALPGRAGRRALAQLNAIRGDLRFRMLRHDGELRDWDRELISKKLDDLVAQYPGLRELIMSSDIDTAVAPKTSAAGFDLTPPSASDRARLETGLSADEKRVLLHHGTEAPFCGGLLSNKEPGAYCCRLCGLPLFKAQTKFESGTGWPSFTEPYDPGHVAGVVDKSYGMVRTETRCGRCDSHQGHVFPDGPRPTGLRYCINSVSLSFVGLSERFPDPLNRGEADLPVLV